MTYKAYCYSSVGQSCEQEDLHTANNDKGDQALNLKNDESDIWQKHNDGISSDYENFMATIIF